MKDWFTFLLDKDLRTLVKQNGVIVPSLAKTPLTENPGGWQDIAIAWERKLEELGITRNFTAPLTFHFDGAQILREWFYNRSIEEKLYLLLMKRTLEWIPPTPGMMPAHQGHYHWHYKYFYRGEVDPTTIKHTYKEVTASVVEGGIVAKYKANKSTEYEIPVYQDPETILVKMDGIILQERVNFLCVDGFSITPLFGTSHTIPFSFIIKEGDAPGVAVFSQNEEKITNFSDYFTQSTNYFLKVSDTVTFRMRGTLKVRVTTNMTGYGFAFQLWKNNNTVLPSSGIAIGSTGTPTGDFAVDVDYTFTLHPNDAIFFIFRLSNLSSGGDYAYEFLPDTNIYFSFQNTYKNTFIPVLKPSTVFKRLTAKMLNLNPLSNQTSSNLLAQNDGICLTSGDAIRGIAFPSIKTNLSDFTKFCKAVMASDIGIEDGKLIIEPYEHFLNTSDPTPLGEIRQLVVSEAQDQLVNTVSVGYPAQQIDDVNGRYSFNNTFTFTSGVTRATKELSLICPYIADPYVIELFRVEFDGKDTTDGRKDNTVMLLDVDLSTSYTDPTFGTYYKLKKDNTLTVTSYPQFPDPASIFNIGLSPKRLMLKQQRLIDALFFGFTGQSLKFSTTERNKTLQTVDAAGNVIDEDANFPITNNPLFIPKYFDFTTVVPANLPELMEADPNRFFTFTWKGTIYSGFALKAGISPSDNKEQAYKLIATPLNDFSKLTIDG